MIEGHNDLQNNTEKYYRTTRNPHNNTCAISVIIKLLNFRITIKQVLVTFGIGDRLQMPSQGHDYSRDNDLWNVVPLLLQDLSDASELDGQGQISMCNC